MDETSARWDYEHSDVSPRLVAALAAGIGTAVVAIPLLLLLGYPGSTHRGDIGALPTPPAPRLQLDPAADLAALRAREDARLTTYGWSDREQAIARIPIARAMALTAERGLAGWPGTRTPASPQPPPANTRR
jgi:hypothetical protein